MAGSLGATFPDRHALEGPLQPPVPTESPPCLLCGAEDFTTVRKGLVDQVWRKPGSFQVQQCSACGFWMTRPRPRVPDGLGFYYADTYSGEGGIGLREFYESDLGKLLLNTRVWIIQKVYDLGEEDRLLEVGCSYGGFLRQARELTGCRCYGLDFDEGSIEGALDPEHIEYSTGTLPEADYDDDAFTVVAMYHLLEHVPDPMGTLRAAWRVLEPGGHVVVEVPNNKALWRYVFGGMWLPWFIPQHLSHFDKRSLTAAVERAGFEVVRHQSVFLPVEACISFVLGFHRVFGLPGQNDPWSWKRPFGKAVELMGGLIFFLLDIPVGLVMRFAGGSGTQQIIARKVEAPRG